MKDIKSWVIIGLIIILIALGAYSYVSNGNDELIDKALEFYEANSGAIAGDIPTDNTLAGNTI